MCLDEITDHTGDRQSCQRVMLTNAHDVPTQEEDRHHGEAIVQVQLRVCAAQRMQAPAHEHKRRAALPQQEHASCST